MLRGELNGEVVGLARIPGYHLAELFLECPGCTLPCTVNGLAGDMKSLLLLILT